MGSQMKAEEKDPKKLVRAMEMVTKVLMHGELQSVRQAITELETKMSGQIDAIRKELTDAISKAQEEVSSRIEPLFETIAEAERFRQTVISDLETQVEKAQSSVNEGMETLRTTVEQSLELKEAELRKELATLAEEQVGLKKGVQEQVEDSKRLSGVLDNLANVFSAATGAKLPGAEPSGNSGSTESAKKDGDDEEVVFEEFLDQPNDGDSPDNRA